MDYIRKRGVKVVAADTTKFLADRADWIACHLDVDVVEPDAILSVNFPAPGGLRPAEASTLIKSLEGTGKFRTIDIAAYNPSLDDDGSSAAAVVGLVTEGLR
jgi:arginase